LKRRHLEKHLTIKNCDRTFLRNILRFIMLKSWIKIDDVSTLPQPHYQVKKCIKKTKIYNINTKTNNKCSKKLFTSWTKSFALMESVWTFKLGLNFLIINVSNTKQSNLPLHFLRILKWLSLKRSLLHCNSWNCFPIA